MARSNLRVVVQDLAVGLSMATLATTTFSTIIDLGNVENIGMDWNFAAGTIDVDVEILQSNKQTGPFTLWTSPDVADTDATNSFTISTNTGGTSLRLSISRFAKIKITNSGLSTITINRLSVVTN